MEAAVGKEVGRLVKPGPVREAIMVPWRLDKTGRPPNVGVMAEVEAALGTRCWVLRLQQRDSGSWCRGRALVLRQVEAAGLVWV